MPLPPRFFPHLPPTSREDAEFSRDAAASAAPRPARSDDPYPCSTAVGTTSPPPRTPPAGTATAAAGSSSPTAPDWSLDRVGRPRPALLPAQPLLQVAEPVLLPEPRREQFHHLQPRQFHRRGHQGEPLLVSRDGGDDRLDRHLPPQDPPQADDLLPADRPLPSVDEGGPELPLRLPPAAPAGRLQPLTPLGLRSRLPLGALLRGQGQGVQPSVAPQAGEEIDPGRAA